MDEYICDDIEWGNIIYCCFDFKLGGWILFFYLNKFLF